MALHNVSPDLLAQWLKEKYPESQRDPDHVVVRRFLQENRAFTPHFENGALVNVSWDDSLPVVPTAEVDRKTENSAVPPQSTGTGKTQAPSGSSERLAPVESTPPSPAESDIGNESLQQAPQPRSLASHRLFWLGIAVAIIALVSVGLWARFAKHLTVAKAQFYLASKYEKGHGVAQNYSRAAYWYRKAAEHGYADAQTYLGILYVNGTGVQKDDAQAVHWYRKAAEQGEAAAENNLGDMYHSGDGGLAKDDRQAVGWWRKAAEQGFAPAEASLGAAYNKGFGVERDDSQALYWERKAAEQGNANGEFNLGVDYESGYGVVKDDDQAASWYEKSAAQGVALAEANLATMYFNGRGVAKDIDQAVNWWRKAAEQGDARSQYNLANCYEYGDGVQQDERQAIFWYQKAAAQQYEDAKLSLDKRLADQREEQREEQEEAIMGTPIDFTTLYADANGAGLEIGRRYQVAALVKFDGSVTTLYSEDWRSTDSIHAGRDFDEDTQLEAVMKQSLSHPRDLVCTVVVSMGDDHQLLIHRAENCHTQPL